MTKRNRGPKSKVLGHFTQTVATQFSTGAEMFVPGWDKEMAAGQEMAHLKPRAKMGQKLTPIGCGTLRPRRQ